MSASDEQETTLLISQSGIHTAPPDTRELYSKKLAQYFILACTLFDRIAFYSLANIVFTTLCNGSFRWNVRHSQTAILIFSGTSYISTLIFAVISDAKLGRARTMIIGFALYLFGYTMVIITVSEQTSFCLINDTIHRNATVIGEENCAAPILGTLICTAIGSGAIKLNTAVFGAEQIQESKITSRYFYKYVMVVNIGNMIAILVVPYIQNKITRDDYYLIPHLVAAFMLFVAALLFLIGWRHYIHVQSNETVVTKCIPVVINAFQIWHQYKRNNRSVVKQNMGFIQLKTLNASNNRITEEEPTRKYKRPSAFLDFAKKANHGRFKSRIVDDVKTLRKAFVVFILLLPYWLICDQSTATFPLQGTHMKYPQDENYIVSWISLGNPVTIIIGIIIFNTFVYKYLNAMERTLKIVDKFVIGMCFASISMCITGVVEGLRQRGCETDSSSSLSIYTQLPQNIFLGFSQLFAVVASYEYAYFGAPLSAQSLFMSFHFCSIGIASFISTAYIYIFPNPKTDIDFKCQTVEQSYWSFYTYFFNLAGLQLIFLIVFIVCQKKFQIVKVNPVQLEREDSFFIPTD